MPEVDPNLPKEGILKFKKLSISYGDFLYDSNKKFPPPIVLKEGKMITYELTIENTGTNSKKLKTDFLILKSPKYNANTVVRSISVGFKFSSIGYGENKASITEYFTNNNISKLEKNRDYYLHILASQPVDGLNVFFKFRYEDTSKNKSIEGIIYDENNIQVAPNPSSGIFKVLLTDIPEGQAQVIDFNGNEVLSKNFKGNTEWDVNIQNKPAGVYILRINTASQVITKKIIKN